MKSKELLILSLGVFLTIVAWMMLDIYHIQTRINNQTKIKSAEVPSYVLDKTIMDVLKQRKE